MRIYIDYKEQELGFDQLRIESAKYLSDFAIRIKFNDGTEKLVDFKPFLSKSLHPSVRKYLDEKIFADFDIVDGNLNWNDYDLIFPIAGLHSGKID